MTDRENQGKDGTGPKASAAKQSAPEKPAPDERAKNEHSQGKRSQGGQPQDASLSPARHKPKRPRRRIDWEEVGEFMSALRSLILTVVVLGLLATLAAVMTIELRQNSVVIDPIRLPGSLSDMGYSEDVAALRLWDAVVQINAAAPTAKERVTVLPASQRIDFEAADAGISLQTMVKILRPFLNIDETRIAGEFICTTPDCAQEGLTLRLRVFYAGGMKILSLPTVGERAGDSVGVLEMDRYFHMAALELLRELDPYLVAFYLYQTDKAAAEREALRLIGPSQPQRKWALNLLGFIAADRGDHDTAIGWYQRAAAADAEGDFAIVYTNWGNSLRAKGDPDGAIEKHKRAIEINPGYSYALINWANALTDKGDLEGALEKIVRAAEIDPDSAFAYNNWGNALYAKGDLRGAAEKYRRATEIDPSNSLAYFNWAMTLADTGDIDSAIDKFNRTLELDPADAVAHANLGIALRDKGDLQGAGESFARATEINPGDAWAFANWGTVLRDQGNLEAAAEKFARAVEIDPGNAFAYNNWGIVLGRQGDVHGAVEKFTRATELDPGDAQSQFNLGLVLRLLNRAGAAADAFQRYLDLDPGVSDADQIRDLIAELRAEAAGG